jgi:membrane protein implicated in regulation of membrane protease activity
MTTYIVWSLICGLCLMLALSSPGFFFFLSFCVGAAAAAVTAGVYDSILAEFAVFFATSLVTFCLLRTYLPYLSRKKEVKTNVFALIGKKAVVVSTITPLSRGWIQVDGEVWSAASADASDIEKDAVVEGVNSAGSHLIVKKIKNT